MSATLLPPLRQPDLDPALRQLDRAVHGARLLLARLLAWFAADPRRVRAAVTGAAVCALVGAMIGLGIGYALSRVAAAVQGFADHLASQSRT